ncbi:MAG: DNA replication and repair protein RecF [Candidatus Levybacteria bacterium]|nr:DNA replication and repair protein RecF [Candidatus Levybacteria bacterium]
MVLKSLSLQNFRSYTKAQYTFDPKLTIIVGPNAAGKTNLVEALSLLATGKSFKTGQEKQLISFGKQVSHVNGTLQDGEDTEDLAVVLAHTPTGMLQKKYSVNGVSKRRTGFAGRLPAVLFTPLDLDIVSGQPGDRRRFLNEVLEQTDQQYDAALTMYSKALRQRNALLEYVQKSGRRDEERFSYWDGLLIANAQIIAEKREALIHYINAQEKTLFPFMLTYDKSVMSRERLLQYRDVEVGAGVTLVGPQRDDVFIQSFHPVSQELEDVKHFCSRGQQRLVTLELKKTQLSYLERQLESKPLLILDDIFSELDSRHIDHVLHMTNDFQTVITTTHREFITVDGLFEPHVIELGK